MRELLPANKTISYYRILSRIGAGGMGEVYLAEDTRLSRKVALKLLPEEFTRNAERLRRFTQEAKAASALNHPNIITIYDIGHTDSLHFIATEHVEGDTLRQHMGRSRMSIGEVLDVGVQVGDALSEAHRAGVVHRDIKPENLILKKNGLVKLLDFGLAKLTQQQPLSADTSAPTVAKVNTEPNVILGTLYYMSPEQARGKDLDARTDVFSFGVLLYEMVTGRSPFEGETTSDVVAAILTKEPEPISSYSPDAPDELQRIIRKALRKDREERFQTMKDMLVDLKSLRQELEFTAKLERSVSPDSGGKSVATGGAATAATAAGQAATTDRTSAPATSSAERVVRGFKQHRKAAVACLTVFILVCVGLYLLLGTSQSAKDTPQQSKNINSLVILPFTNGNPDPNAEFLSDGISESLINRLSQLPQLKVIARSSSFKYKGKEADPQDVANALRVQAVVTGRVVQLGDNLQISVELINALDKTQMWGEQYNRKATDLLQVQSEISREIAEKLRLKLTDAEQQQLAKRETANPQAYELLLKGRFYNNKVGTENRKRAVEYFKQAIDIDPNYAIAHAELSLTYMNLMAFSSFDPKEFMPKAEGAAQKAMELDENLVEAPYALAFIKRVSWQWAAAEQQYKRAIELNPNLARAHNGYALFLSLIGRHDEAIAEIRRARELDPLSPLINLNIGTILYYARRYDEAIEALRKTLELDQNNSFAHFQIGLTYAAKAMYAEAIAAYQEAIRLGEGTPRTQIYLSAAYAKAGERRKAQEILKRIQASGEYVPPGQLAVLYAALGEREQAFAALERAYAARDLQLQYLGVDPPLDPLRSDPRFQDLLSRVGLPQ